MKYQYSLALAAFGYILYGLNLSYPAHAQQLRSTGVSNPPAIVQCGEIIYNDLVMANDIEDCPLDGITIANSNITLDCGWHRISALRYGIDLTNQTDVTIKNCMIELTDRGINYTQSARVNIVNNAIQYSRIGMGGRLISGNNRIVNNQVSETEIGILIEGDNVITNNLIIGNTLTNNSSDEWPYGYGIMTVYVENSSIANNFIFNNGVGMRLTVSNYNRITNNNFGNNGLEGGSGYGLWLSFMSTGNAIWNNTFTANSTNARTSQNSNNNIWNIGKYGNYWDDLTVNSGHQMYYMVGESTGNIDYSPRAAK